MFNQSKLRIFLILCSIISGFLFGIVLFKYQLTVKELNHNSHPYLALFNHQNPIKFDSRSLDSRKQYEVWLKQNKLIKKSIDSQSIKSFPLNQTKPKTESKLLRNLIKVHCLILTRSREHSRTVLDTWSKNCNSVSFYAKFYDNQNPFLARLSLGDESIYSSRTFCKIFIDLLNKKPSFDWLLITIDGTFAIVDNLRFHVATFNSSFPFYLGRPVKHFLQDIYNSLDSGVVLSLGAIQQLSSYAFSSESTCLRTFNNSGLIPTASFDSFIGNELHKLHILPMLTLDNKSSLFHPFSPEKHIHPNLIRTMDIFWNSKVLPTFSGIDACSDYAITFGAFSAGTIRFLDYLLYHVSLSRS